jgi:hypothetical protein
VKKKLMGWFICSNLGHKMDLAVLDDGNSLFVRRAGQAGTPRCQRCGYSPEWLEDAIEAIQAIVQAKEKELRGRVADGR